LVVFRKGVPAFVEVRTRTEPVLVPAPETVTAEKRRRITRAAHDYLAQHHLGGEDVSLRFDVVAILCRPDGSGRPAWTTSPMLLGRHEASWPAARPATAGAVFCARHARVGQHQGRLYATLGNIGRSVDCGERPGNARMPFSLDFPPWFQYIYESSPWRS
jgi:Holliday junction resolvase-like predicted endonuclease